MSTVSPPHAFTDSEDGLLVFVKPSSEMYPSDTKAASSASAVPVGSAVPSGALKIAPDTFGFPVDTNLVFAIF